MHIDIPAVILGMATVTAFVGALLVSLIFLRTDGPWLPKLLFLGALLDVIFGMLTAFYLIAGYILPDDSLIYDQLVAQRPVHTLGLVAACVSAVVLWRLAIRWKPTDELK